MGPNVDRLVAVAADVADTDAETESVEINVLLDAVAH